MLLLMCSAVLPPDWRYEGILPLGSPNILTPDPPTPLVVRDDMGEMAVALPDNQAAAIWASLSGSAPVPKEDMEGDGLSSCCCWRYFRRIEFAEDVPPTSLSSNDLALIERPLLAVFPSPPPPAPLLLSTLASHVPDRPREFCVEIGMLLPDLARWGGDGLDDGDDGDDGDEGAGLRLSDGGGGAPNSRPAAPPRDALPPLFASSDRVDDGGGDVTASWNTSLCTDGDGGA